MGGNKLKWWIVLQQCSYSTSTTNTRANVVADRSNDKGKATTEGEDEENETEGR